GVFPAWGQSDYASSETSFRNACRITVAPTGTISMLADTSSGVEPLFALAWRKTNILEGETLYYINKYFEKDAKKHEFYSDELMEHISTGGSIQDRPDVPQWAKDVYVTSGEISPEAHVLMQAAFQKSCDSGISKTINFPNSATIEDVYSAYMIAWQSKCKGITVYRSGSREKEVLVKAETPDSENVLDITTYDYLEDLIDVPFLTKGESVRLNTCCDSPFIVKEGGCSSCKSCGWSKCHIS
ncbi:uncharacterized protein METZ01_LOCUS450304, partial [marine metagenome]